MVRTVELRSDTFTLPTESMRNAMATAELGDDVWDEDPTIHRLQDRAAEMVGKEDSLFVPSGTMGNLCALISHARPGQEIILEIDSHIFQNEVAGASVVGGLQLRPLDTQDGRLRPDQVGAAIRPAGVLAAASLCALNEMVDRLADDHANARRLADGLQGLAGVEIDLSRVETNMVFGDCRPPLTAGEFIDRCREVGVLLDQASPHRWRMVTHRGVSAEDVDYAIAAVQRLFGTPALSPRRAAG